MGAYLSQPNTNKTSSDGGNTIMSFGFSAMQGWRVSMEDAHNCIPELDEETAMFAVYDGHGGEEVALYCSKYLPDVIKQQKTYKDGKLQKALEDAFMSIDGKMTTEDVIKELVLIAGRPTEEAPNEKVAEEDDLEKEETALLHEEATMTIEELLVRYGLKHKKAASEAKKESGSGDPPPAPHAGDKELNGELEGETDSNGKAQAGGASADGGSSKLRACRRGGAAGGGSGDGSSSAGGGGAAGGGSGDGSSSAGGGGAAGGGSGDGSSSAGGGGAAGGGSGDGSSSAGGGSGDGSSSAGGGGGGEGDSSSGGSSGGEKPGKVEGDAGPSCSSSAAPQAPGDAKSKFFEDSDESEEGEEEEEGSDEEEDGSEEDEGEYSSDNEEEDTEEGEDSEEEEEEEMCLPGMDGKEEPGSDSGTTAVVALIRGKQLTVANAGDSRCVVSEKGRAVDMSYDHKPEDELELARIKNAGGKVTMDGRVNGGLNLSRAIGDHFYKRNKALPPEEQMISAMPDLKVLTLTEEHDFMVIACDGIWNVLSSQEVVDFVSKRIKPDASGVVRPLSSIVEQLLEHCLAPDTSGDGTGCDNMTCMIVTFSPRPCASHAPKKRKPDEIQPEKNGNECKKAKSE